MQRVHRAAVDVDGARIGEISRGMAILLGVGARDGVDDAERLARKLAELRIFDDGTGRLQLTVADAHGAVIVVPQFTLYGDVRRGRRPDLTSAAPPDHGERLYQLFCGALRGRGLEVAQGRFGATMRVLIEGDGPVTIVASTDRWSEAEL